MSYNSTPEWATVVLSSQFKILRCPSCNSNIFQPIHDALSDAQTAGYYHPAHIAPKLYFTCWSCDEELSIELVVSVLHTSLPQREELKAYE